ncbi:ATP synthase subunit B [[Clostridium] sordellii]|uniref:ATP synthase subunit b n=1 Tax=Paraclostridium sordellii TaxID=1505 RepID=A0A0A1S2F4_PARSO|nr:MULTISPECIES: F0F1 ATP synthase subunit B [Paeniclostridium]MDU5020207.1 F0F1 ATP synthase subunit B [Clostridiales bacterium]MTN08177.1 F0F1 ATP synthase subunit B [Turicibacter sanguinis]AUN12962.1 ATP synthase F0 subunit B [Paeniclostridium sordellii]EPZ54363.1 ATP synthase F0, B subunit [[Clostridium] sordellii VPI 9048] [Paeniclostridium sordellii VPI 9048]MBS6025075.1 F0F1 ATP synthase subunit B [Paeniclostridium sordellii]
MFELKPLIGVSYELLFQLINTFLVFVILKKLLFKPVLGIIEARQKDIQTNLAQGEKTKSEGEKFKKEYEEKLSSAKDQGQEIIKQATLRAEKKSEEIISTAKNEATSIKEKASKDIAQERQKVMNEVKDDISSIALLAASKVIESDLDKSKHEKLINDFIKEVGEAQ